MTEDKINIGLIPIKLEARQGLYRNLGEYKGRFSKVSYKDRLR